MQLRLQEATSLSASDALVVARGSRHVTDGSGIHFPVHVLNMSSLDFFYFHVRYSTLLHPVFLSTIHKFPLLLLFSINLSAAE